MCVCVCVLALVEDCVLTAGATDRTDTFVLAFYQSQSKQPSMGLKDCSLDVLCRGVGSISD